MDGGRGWQGSDTSSPPLLPNLDKWCLTSEHEENGLCYDVNDVKVQNEWNAKAYKNEVIKLSFKTRWMICLATTGNRLTLDTSEVSTPAQRFHPRRSGLVNFDKKFVH